MNQKHDLQGKLEMLFQGAKNFTPGSIIDVDILHDDKCPAITTGSMADCTCQPEFKFRQRVTDAIARYEKKRNS